LGTGTIPAKYRFENGGLFTVCPEAVTEVRKHIRDDAGWQIGPNPVRRELHISAPPGDWSGTFQIRVFDMQGKLLSAKEYQQKQVRITLDKNLKSGVYLVEITTKKNRFLKKIVLIN